MSARIAFLWGGLSCLPGLALLLATIHGQIGITYDSVYYMDAAQSLVTTGELKTTIAPSPSQQFAPDGTLISDHPFVTWPAGMPIALAGLAKLGIPLTVAPIALNAACLMVLIGCSFVLAARKMPVPSATVCAASVGVLPIVHSVFRMAWSEPLFIAIRMLALVNIIRAIDDPSRSRWSWPVAGVLAGFSTGVRYLGVTMLALHALAFAFLVVSNRSPWRRLLFGLSLGPLVAVLIVVGRSMLLRCWPCDQREIVLSSILRNIGDLFSASAMALPVVRAYPGAWDSAIAIAVLALLLTTVLRRRPTVKMRSTVDTTVLIVFAGIYAGLLLALKTISYFDPIDARLLSPSIVAGSVAVLLALFARSNALKSQVAVAAYLVIVAALDSRSPTMRWRTLNDPRIAESRAFQQIRRSMSSARTLVSDDVPTLAWQTGRRVIWLPPLDVLRHVKSPLLIVLNANTDAADATELDLLTSRASKTWRDETWNMWWIDGKSVSSDPSPTIGR